MLTNYIPLTLGAEHTPELAQVVDKTGNLTKRISHMIITKYDVIAHLHPVWLAISADGLGSLQEMLDLGYTGLHNNYIRKILTAIRDIGNSHQGPTRQQACLASPLPPRYPYEPSSGN